jgi:hypothetical protein
MKKHILIILIFLSFGTLAYADRYLLVMSKDDKVGQHMYKLINQDMGKHGKFIPENHEEYNQIKWDSDIAVYSKRDEKNIYLRWTRTGKIAIFDINNDGQDDTVLFERYSLSNVLRDKLSLLPLEYYTRFKEKLYIQDIMKNGIWLDGEAGLKLKEFPVQKIDDVFGSLTQRYIGIGGLMYIRPLKIGSKYYVSLFGSHGQGVPYPPMDQNNIIVISQYDKNNQLQDICYFIRAYTWEKRKENK